MEQLPCKNTFDMTIHIAITAVKEKLAKGSITAKDLDEIEAALTIENKKVDAFCHSIHERCMSKSKLDLTVPPRTNAYGRIMIQPLEKLMDRRHRRFSEKQIPNFFHVISSILGRENYEKWHDKMADLMRDEIRDHGSHFTWDKFYQHPGVVECRLKTLGAIAHAFQHFDQRMNWFLNIMESTPTSPEDGSGSMQFTEQQAKFFLLALFEECQGMNDQRKEFFENILPKSQRSDIVHLISKVSQM